jgi:hypothetical protein
MGGLSVDCATGCAAAITEVLVKARVIKEIRENFIFVEDLKNSCTVVYSLSLVGFYT